MGSFKKAPKMSKIRDNPFYFIFLSLISSGVKQLPVSYGLILINFASFLVNAAQYILIIGSYLYTSYSNWSLRRLRRRVDDFMNTKGTSTISDVDLDSAIRLTQSQILSSLRESGHLTGHFVQGQQQGHSQQQVEMTQGQFYTEQQQILQQRATQHRDGTQTQQSAMTQQSTMSPVMTQQTMSFQQTSQPTQVPQQQASQPRLRKSQPPQSRLDRNQPVQKHQSNSSQSRDRIQSQDRQVINRTPSKYVTEPRIHSSRSVIESSIDSLCSERSDINERPGSLSGHSRSNDQIPLKVSQSGDQIYEQEEPEDLISLKEVSTSSHSPTNHISPSASSSVLRKRHSSDQSNSSPENARTETSRTSVAATPPIDEVSSVPTEIPTTDRSSTVRNTESSLAESFTGKIIESAQKVFSRSSRRSSVSTSTSSSDLHNRAFLEDPTNSSGSLLQQEGPSVEMDSQRLTVVRGDEEQARQSLAAEMPRMTLMQQQFGTISEENSSSGGSFDPFADDHASISTNQNFATVQSSDPNRRLDAGDTGSQLEIIGGVKYLKNRLQMEKEALIKIKNEQALAKTRNDQMVDEAVCKIDSVKTNIRGNLNQIRNLFKP